MPKKPPSPKKKLANQIRKVGRPSKYCQEIADRIVDLILDDFSMREIALMPDMPERSTILRWEAQHNDFAAKIARARETGQAEAVVDTMIEIERKLAAGEIDPQAARVAIWSKQWRASKLNRKRYGEKQEVEVSQTGSVVAILEEIAAERAALRAPGVQIEARAIDKTDEEKEDDR